MEQHSPSRFFVVRRVSLVVIAVRQLRAHHIAALVKGCIGVFEFIVGIFVVFLSEGAISGVSNFFLGAEQLEDPNDPLVLWVQHFLALLLPIKTVLGCALLVLGLLKIIGAIGVFRQKTWGFLLLIIIVVSPIPFELVEVVKHPQIIPFGLLILNAVVVSLLLAQYPRQTRGGEKGTDISPS